MSQKRHDIKEAWKNREEFVLVSFSIKRMIFRGLNCRINCANILNTLFLNLSYHGITGDIQTTDADESQLNCKQRFVSVTQSFSDFGFARLCRAFRALRNFNTRIKLLSNIFTCIYI